MKEVSLKIKIEGLINTSTNTQSRIFYSFVEDDEGSDGGDGGLPPVIIDDDEEEGRVLSYPPEAVTNLTISNIGNYNAKVSWTASIDATSYRVMCGIMNQSITNDTTTPNTYQNFTNLVDGEAYSVLVYAINEYGTSNYSSINFATIPVLPEGDGSDYDNDYYEREHDYEEYTEETYGDIPFHNSTHTLIVNGQKFTKTIDTNNINWEIVVNVPIRKVVDIHWSTTDTYNWFVVTRANNKKIAKSFSGNQSNIRILVLKRMIIPIRKKESTTKVRRITGISRSGLLEQKIKNRSLNKL